MKKLNKIMLSRNKTVVFLTQDEKRIKIRHLTMREKSAEIK